MQSIYSPDNVLNYKELNRYAVISSSSQKTQKAYYFSTPVFNKSNERLNFKFKKQGNCYSYNGSNGLFKIYNDRIVLYNGEEEILLIWEDSHNISMLNEGAFLKATDMILYPTFNGILIKHRGNKAKMTIKVNKHFDIRCNSKCFAFMKSKFEPIVTFNSMFAQNRYRDVFYNAQLLQKKITDTSYELEIVSNCSDVFQLTYDINIYEPKLIQDTTVESNHPKENNAYGSVSFLGKSTYCGTQILYSRIDISKMNFPKDLIIDNVKLHIPYYTVNGNNFGLSVPQKRFCSFGSTWNNKIPYSTADLSGTRGNGYITFDISKYVISKSGKWNYNKGFVIQSQGEHFSIIGTGDNYYTPQIIEITYKIKEDLK